MKRAIAERVARIALAWYVPATGIRYGFTVCNAARTISDTTVYDLDCVPLLRLEHAALKQVMARVRGVHERRRSRRHLAPQGRGGDDLVGGGGGDVGLQRHGAERADEPKPHGPTATAIPAIAVEKTPAATAASSAPSASEEEAPKDPKEKKEVEELKQLFSSSVEIRTPRSNAPEPIS